MERDSCLAYACDTRILISPPPPSPPPFPRLPTLYLYQDIKEAFGYSDGKEYQL